MDNEFWRMAGATGAQLACTSHAWTRHIDNPISTVLALFILAGVSCTAGQDPPIPSESIAGEKAFISNGSGGRSRG